MITNKHLKAVLTEMCNRVGAHFDDIDFKKERWFWDYEWTKDEENEFKSWFIEYLQTNKKAKKELMRLPRITKLDKFVESFLSNYGWRIK